MTQIEKHFIQVENNEKVAAVHHEAGSDKFVFFCHGFGGNKQGNTGERARISPEHGFNGVALDFRGNGESSGEFIEQTLSSRIRDLETVVEYFDPGSFVLFGSSFGGKVVFHASQELEPDAVVGKAPVTYSGIMDKFKSVVEEKGRFEYIDGKPIDQRFIDDLYSYSFEDVTGLECPAAIFHGGSDTTVHPEYSFRAAQELQADVMLQKFEGEKHRFSKEAEQRMRELMFDWLNSVITLQ